MRHPLYFILFFLLATSVASAQYQPYGIVDKALLTLNACDFENEADAMVVFDHEVISVDINMELIIERHKRIKIFKTSGLKNALVQIEYRSYQRFEKISDINGQTINLDAKGTIVYSKLDKQQLIDEPSEGGNNLVTFTLPNAMPGSVLEYSYKIRSSRFRTISGWNFQSTLPTRLSEVIVSMPDLYTIKEVPRCAGTVETDSSEIFEQEIFTPGDLNATRCKGVRKKFFAQSVPSFKSEPQSIPARELLCGIDFILYKLKPVSGEVINYITTWPQVATDFNAAPAYGMQLYNKIPFKSIVEPLETRYKESAALAAALFDTVKNSMNCTVQNSIVLGNSLTSVWEKKSGNGSEINAILFMMLNSAGLRVSPVLMHTQLYNNESTPATLEQFNRLVVRIEMDDNTFVMLDASGPNNVYNLLPKEFIGKNGFKINRSKPYYEWIPVNAGEYFSKSLLINEKLNPDGTIAGTAVCRYYNYAMLDYKDKTSASETLRFKYYNTPGIVISTIEPKTVTGNSCSDLLTFTSTPANEGEGNLIYVPVRFNEFIESPFKSPERKSPIKFNYPLELKISVTFELPDEFEMVNVPERDSLLYNKKELVFVRTSRTQENTVQMHYFISITKLVFKPEEYDELKVFYDYLISSMNAPVTIRRKS